MNKYLPWESTKRVMAGYRRPGKADLSLVKGELRREPGSAKFNGVGGVEEKTNDQKRTWHLEHKMVSMW